MSSIADQSGRSARGGVLCMLSMSGLSGKRQLSSVHQLLVVSSGHAWTCCNRSLYGKQTYSTSCTTEKAAFDGGSASRASWTVDVSASGTAGRCAHNAVKPCELRAQSVLRGGGGKPSNSTTAVTTPTPHPTRSTHSTPHSGARDGGVGFDAAFGLENLSMALNWPKPCTWAGKP